MLYRENQNLFAQERVDYVYDIWRCNVLNINKLFQSKIIWEENNRQTWVMYKTINKGKKSKEKFLSTIPNLHTIHYLVT